MLDTAAEQGVRCAKELCGCMDFIHKVSMHKFLVSLMSTILLVETVAIIMSFRNSNNWLT